MNSVEPKTLAASAPAGYGAGRPGDAPIPESIRNPLLRRVDWRFLLPDPNPARTLCLCDGPLADAARLISTRVDGIEGAEPEVFDLAIAERADVAVLAAAVVGLRVGGYLYLEDGRELGSGEERIRRHLAEMGLRLVGMWAPLPRPARGTPEQWVPLEAPEAARSVMRGRTPAPSLERSIRRGLAEALWIGSPAIRHRAPFCVLAERVGGPAGGEDDPAAAIGSAPDRGGGDAEAGGHAGAGRAAGPADGQGSTSDLPEMMRSMWSECGLGPAPQRVTVALLSAGRRSVNKVVALAFPDGGAVPAAVLKIPRVAESIAGLNREVATLTDLSEREGRPGGIPRILFRAMRGTVPITAQTYMPGRRVVEVLDTGRLAAITESATDWQIALGGAGAGVWSSDLLRTRTVDPAVESFCEVFGTAVDRVMLDDAIAIVRGIGELPRVCEQRDFSPWNVLVTPDGALSVLDWESSVLDGVPLLDLIYFLAYAFVTIENGYETGDYAGAYRSMLDRSRPNGDHAARCIGRYAERFGMAASDIRALRILLWMTHAPSVRAELAAEGRAAARSVAELRRHPYAQFWGAEVRYGA